MITTKRSRCFAMLILCLICITPSVLFGHEYHTTWCGHFNLVGLSITVPGQFEARAMELACVWNSIGLGTSVVKLYNKGGLGDSIELAGFIAPAYFYYVPFGAHRKSWEVIPVLMYCYAGGSGWGLKQGMLVDFGLGFNYYLLSLRIGYNAIKTESRLFFNVDDSDFNDWPIRCNRFYISIDLSPGLWLALKSRLRSESQ